jgi:Protein of unknown function (DUF1800)
MAAMRLPCDRIDPAEAWQPWSPSRTDPWGRKWAAHLYRRAGFGPGRADLIEAERLGLEGTIDRLLRGARQAEAVLPTLTDAGRIAAARDEGGDQLRDWWLYCMLQGGHPLREKLTLFWHNHFATSIVKVQDPVLMYRQNCLLRAHALGKFGPLLQAVSRDGAMLVWLDANTNVKGKPNENYARELMELFSLGVGNYTETDVREAARAFTGWHIDGGSFSFKKHLHDSGTKTVLGRTGPWDGGDVVRIVLKQPVAARFLVRKLYHFLVSENGEPPDTLLEPLCASFRKSDYDIAELVKVMLSSQHFFSAHAFRQRIKSPVEYVLGAVQAVYRRQGERETADSPLPQRVLVRPLGALGQQLFAPPNVKGWKGGPAWLNSASVLQRANFAASVALGTLWASALPPTVGPLSLGGLAGRSTRPASGGEPVLPRALDPARLLEEEKVGRPEDVVRVLLDLYLPGGVAPRARARLVAFVAEGKPTGLPLDQRVRQAVHAILTMPEYHLA